MPAGEVPGKMAPKTAPDAGRAAQPEPARPEPARPEPVEPPPVPPPPEPEPEPEPVPPPEPHPEPLPEALQAAPGAFGCYLIAGRGRARHMVRAYLGDARPLVDHAVTTTARRACPLVTG
jgi:hypothetical protein